MSSPYDRYDRGSRRRGLLSHWVPLAVTVTIATVGLAAWVWSQRNDEHDDEVEPYHQDLDYENADYGDNPAYGASGGGDSGVPRPPPSFGDGGLRAGETGYGTTQAPPPDAASGWGTHMSGALRRTPSPQQFFDSARKTVAAGVTAAGAAVGSALSAIREEDKNAYADHETWSEEADAKREKPTAAASSSQSKGHGKRRKTIAIVVTADGHIDDLDGDGFHEHAVSHEAMKPCNAMSTHWVPELLILF